MALVARVVHNVWVTFADQRQDGDHKDVLGLTVAAVARRLGVAPATLRTWDRRYGLGPSQHTAGAHRRYTVRDLARLELMRRLVLAGVPPVDAARTALDNDGETTPDVAQLTVRPTAQLPSSPSDATAAGGGRVVPIPGGIPAARGLARAAMSLDSVACQDIVRDTVEKRGVIWTWEHLLIPVLSGIGTKWATSGTGIEVEHLLSESVMATFTGLIQRMRNPINARTVLLACSDNEMHSLPLFATAAALAERRIGSRVLGARVPSDALIAAIRRTGPASVLVWSQTSATGDLSQLGLVPEVRPAPLIMAAGPGWHGQTPAGVVRIADMTEAVSRIAASVGA